MGSCEEELNGYVENAQNNVNYGHRHYHAEMSGDLGRRRGTQYD